MKRIFTLFLASFLILSLLVSCGTERKNRRGYEEYKALKSKNAESVAEEKAEALAGDVPVLKTEEPIKDLAEQPVSPYTKDASKTEKVSVKTFSDAMEAIAASHNAFSKYDSYAVDFENVENISEKLGVDCKMTGVIEQDGDTLHCIGNNSIVGSTEYYLDKKTGKFYTLINGTAWFSGKITDDMIQQLAVDKIILTCLESLENSQMTSESYNGVNCYKINGDISYVNYCKAVMKHSGTGADFDEFASALGLSKKYIESLAPAQIVVYINKSNYLPVHAVFDRSNFTNSVLGQNTGLVIADKVTFRDFGKVSVDISEEAKKAHSLPEFFSSEYDDDLDIDDYYDDFDMDDYYDDFDIDDYYDDFDVDDYYDDFDIDDFDDYAAIEDVEDTTLY